MTESLGDNPQSDSGVTRSGLDISSDWRGAAASRQPGRSADGVTAGDTILEEAEEVADVPYGSNLSAGSDEDDDIDDEAVGEEEAFRPSARKPPARASTSYTDSFVEEDRTLSKPPAAAARRGDDPMLALMEEEHAAMTSRLGEEVERLEGRLAELKRAMDAKLAQLRRQAEGPEATRDAANKAVLIGAMRLVRIKVSHGYTSRLVRT